MTRSRLNGDERRRAREREALQAGTVEGQARVLTDRLRAGVLQPWHVTALSAIDYEPAQVASRTTYASLLATQPRWDENLRDVLLRDEIPGLELQRQFLRVAGIGACLVSERLAYLPLARFYVLDLRREEGSARADPSLSVMALNMFRSMVSTERHDPSAYVGVAGSYGSQIRLLHDLRHAFHRYDFGGESVLADHAGAVAVLARLMTTLDEGGPRPFRGHPAGAYLENLYSILGALEGAFTFAMELTRGEDPIAPLEPLARAVHEAQDRVAADSDSDPPRYWSIRNEAGDYWSNQDGWTWDSHAATEFRGRERYGELRLPLGGRWVPGRSVPELYGVSALLRQGAVDLLIPWLLTGP